MPHHDGLRRDDEFSRIREQLMRIPRDSFSHHSMARYGPTFYIIKAFRHIFASLIVSIRDTKMNLDWPDITQLF